MLVMAGDIGGTQTRLRIARADGDQFHVVRERHFSNQGYAGFQDVLAEFLNEDPGSPITASCLGVAGPVQPGPDGQFVQVTNLPWRIDSRDLSAKFAVGPVRLINDLQAIAFGLEHLRDADRVVLQTGAPVAHGPRAVLAAGTGLGQAYLVWQQDHYDAIATEGGHADFGPTDALQLELARWLVQKYGRASYEQVLSGPGLVRLYTFLRDTGVAPESAAMAASLRQGDPAAAITRAALQQLEPLADRALDLFVAIYAAQAGNLALAAGATGGVYLAGGIAPKILPRLTAAKFLQMFRHKGEMAAFVTRVPLTVVVGSQPALLGAQRVAARIHV